MTTENTLTDEERAALDRLLPAGTKTIVRMHAEAVALYFKQSGLAAQIELDSITYAGHEPGKESHEAMRLDLDFARKAALALFPFPQPEGQSTDRPKLWLHKKTGGVYEWICNARLEASGDMHVVYRSSESGFYFVRPATEFLDGRFERVAVIPDIAKGKT